MLWRPNPYRNTEEVAMNTKENPKGCKKQHLGFFTDLRKDTPNNAMKYGTLKGTILHQSKLIVIY